MAGCGLVFPFTKDPLTPTNCHQDNISKDQLEPQQIASGQFNSNGRDMQVSNLVSLFDTLSILTQTDGLLKAVDLMNFKQCL